jgi:hypothetical protein
MPAIQAARAITGLNIAGHASELGKLARTNAAGGSGHGGRQPQRLQCRTGTPGARQWSARKAAIRHRLA